MRHLILSIITILTFSIVLTACGGGSGGGSDDTPVADDTPKPIPEKTLNFDNTEMKITLSDAWDEYIAHFNTSGKSLSTISKSGQSVSMNALLVFGTNRTDLTRSSANQSWDDADSAQNIDITRLLGSAASIDFDTDGTIKQVEIHFDGIRYLVDDFTSSTNLSASSDKARNTHLVGLADADSATLTIERGASFFGFDSDYMVYVNATADRAGDDATNDTLTEHHYDYDAILLAGIETVNFTQLLGTVNFDGKGRGIYGNQLGNDATIFDVNAEVDFSNQNLIIKTSNTCKNIVNADCTENGADRLNSLNLTTDTLSFAAGNNISGTANASDLTGTLDARFYGYKAWEFGGTFALANDTNNSYYYGAFGANRKGIVTPLAFSNPDITVTPPAPWATNIAASNSAGKSLSAISKSGESASMNALLVFGTHLGENQRSPNRAWDKAGNGDHYGDNQETIIITRLLGASTSIAFVDNEDANTDGAIEKVEINFTANNFTVENFTSATSLSATNNTDNISALDDADSTTLTIERGASFFGFNSNYMLYVSATADKAGNYATNDALKEYNYDYDAMLLTGIETVDFTKLLGTVNFDGKGRGIHGNEAGNYATIFDVTVAVNFGNKNLIIKSNNTCKAVVNVACTDEAAELLPQLEFTTSALSFADAENNNAISNNISGVANAGDLTGTADARFYGTDAKEFGGTFALTHKTDNSYYYGAFGANRDGIATGYNALTIFDSHSVITPQTVTIADDADTVAYVSLSAASADTDNAVAKTFILNGLTVHGTITNIHQRVPSQQWETVDYSQTATGATIDDSALSLAFATDGTLSGVTAHLNDGTNDVSYIAGTADNTPTTTSFGATISSGAPSDATSTSINVERGSDFFGFASNYMVYLNWNIQETFLDANLLNETTYNIDGMMLAGMRLDGNNIRKNGTAEFSGKGRGIYGDKDFNYATIFDVTANVNFGAANVKFESSNTCKAIDCGDNPVNTLDFTSSSLSFIALDNYNISGGLFADDNKLVGTIYARFYGTQGWELGGTFGLEDNARFYYGAFGTQRLTGIVTPLTFDNTPIAVTLPNDVTLNADSSLSISSVVDAAIADETLDDTPHTLVMGAIAASNDDSTHYQRSQNMAWAAYNDAADSQRTISTSRLTGAAASLSFDETTGYISGVTAYADATYTATADAPASATSFTATNADGVTINLERGTNLFGFDSDYMAYLSWQSQSDDMFENNNATLNEIIYDRDGIMLAGIETIDVNRISGITSFTGKGRGFYDDDSLFKDDASYATIFDVTAAIDFANKNIALTIDETCKASDCSVKTTHLDLGTIALAFPTADDKYVVANNITGVANADNGNLTGNIDARFYSTEAREFGGTFALAGTINGSNNYYHGAFGLVRSTYIISTNHGTTTHADTPTNINQHGLTGFNDEARKGNGSGTSDNALQIATSVQITKGNADGFASDTIITEKITGAVIEFDYDSDGDFFVDQNQLTTLYVADKEYYIYSGSGSEGAITYDSGGVDGADKLSLRRDRFGFTDNASYMARIAWEVTADKNYGYGIVGYETDGTNLTNIGNENANFTNTPFTGKGRGRYSDINNTDANIYFDISADIDFANRTATLKSSETCTHLLAAKCAEAEFQRHDLNFTGELKYDANKNNVFGVLTTAGFTDINNSDNNIASLAGTADARFYGPNANEFGGTFALQNNIAAYAGWFGVARENIIYQQVANTPTKKANEGGIIPNNITINHNNLTILDEGGDRDNRIGKTNNLFNAYAVQLINDTQNQTITTERIDGALFEISFVAEDGGQIDLDYIDDNDIVIVENSPILYLGDKKYDLSSIFTNDGNGLNDTFNDGNKIERAIFDEVNDVAFTTPSIVNINNSWNQHGFTARYVYLLEWTINDSTVDTYGVTLFGIETAGGDIPTTGTNVQFVGRGYGKYQDSSNSSDNARYFFDIEADINFATRKIDLEAINTCTVRSDNCGDDNEYINGIYKIENGERRSHLDFKGTLSYGVDTDMNPVNDINGNDFTTKGDDLVYNDDATELTGDAHARFYGTGTNGAKEFGGTFRMQNDDTAYIGFFSACDGVKNATNYSSNCNYID